MTTRRSRRRRTLLRAGAGVLLVGCTDLFGPGLPDGTIPLAPLPAEYEGWWDLAERCSGLQGSFDQVDWGVIPGVSTIPDTDGAVGSYYSERHQIVLVEPRVYDGHLVRHEMLHALRRAPGHPRDTFVESCGGLVSCGGPCLEEAERTGPPASTGPIVETGAMEVTAEVRPRIVSLTSGTRGCVTIVVNVRNPRDEEVRVDLSRFGTLGWSVDGLGAGGGGRFPIDDTLVLTPGSTRSYAFDCPGPLAEGLTPGNYFVRGRFGSERSDRVLLKVTP